jgi:hypothetical protein
MTASQKTSSALGSVLLGLGLVLLLLGERVFGMDTARNALSGGGAVLVLGALMMRLQAIRSMSGDAKAVEQRLLAADLGVVLALGLYALATPEGLEFLGLTDSAAERTAGALSSLWVSVLVVSLFALLFGELVYLGMPVTASVELRRVRTSLHAGLSLGFSVVFLFSMNYVAVARDVRKDVSYFKTTRPSDGTFAMLRRLDQPVKVLLFFERTNDVLGRVEPYFQGLDKGSDKLSYEVADVALLPELAQKHKVRGNGNVLLLRGAGDEEKGQVFEVGEELTAARANLKKLDGLFQQAFTKLVRPELTVHLSVGHGEHNAKGTGSKELGDGTQALEQLFKRLNLKTKNLGITEGLGSAVPEGASAVLVVGPSEKFLREEAESLLAYVRKGGRLMLMVDPNRELGLEPLLEGLSLQLLPGTLTSDGHHMSRTYSPADKVIVYSNTYTSHPVVTTVSRHQREVATVFVRGGALARTPKDATPKPKVTFPLHSTADFWRDLDGDYELSAAKGEKKEALSMVAAVSVPQDKGSEGRVIVIGDGDFMTDKLAGNNGNLLLFVDGLAWLIGNEDLTGEVSSEEDVAIEHSREEDKLWFYATTFAVPAPVLFGGLWISRRRRRRAESRP